MASGLLIACLLILLTEGFTHPRILLGLNLPLHQLPAMGAVVLLILLHAVLVHILGGAVDWLRLLGSMVFILLVLLAAACMRRRLKRLRPADVHRLLMYTTLMLTAMALRSLVGEPVFPPLYHHAPVVVFIEPSHFSLAYVPFIGYAIVQARGMRRWLIVLAAVILALALKSTTLLAALLLILLVCQPFWKALAFVVIGAGVAVALNFDTSYYINRIVISDDVQNLSNLVLLQGWERAFLVLEDSTGLGLGFQQFGVYGPMGSLQEVIYGLNDDYLNLYDGGSSASKLVAEFGLVGIVLLLAYLIWLLRTASGLQRMLRGKPQPALAVFLPMCLVAIGVELFIRGVGYLSPGLFLFGLMVMGAAPRPSPVPTRAMTLPVAEG